MTRRRSRPEDEIQRAIFQHLAARGAPNCFAFHPANGGKRGPIEAAILRGLGVRAGVPDVIAIHEGRVYALELKVSGGRLTEAQLDAIAAMEAAGASCCIAEGLDRALAVLEGWGLLRGRAFRSGERRANPGGCSRARATGATRKLRAEGRGVEEACNQPHGPGCTYLFSPGDGGDNVGRLGLSTKTMDHDFRLANLRRAPRCGAKTRAGRSCQCPALRGRKRCRIHGGLSPGAPRGRKNGNFKNGEWTAEAIEERKWLRSLVRDFAQKGGGS
jgi:hypothetical protein